MSKNSDELFLVIYPNFTIDHLQKILTTFFLLFLSIYLHFFYENWVPLHAPRLDARGRRNPPLHATEITPYNTAHYNEMQYNDLLPMFYFIFYI